MSEAAAKVEKVTQGADLAAVAIPPPSATPSPVAPPVPSVTIDARGLKPTTLEELWRLAAMIAKSELVPKDYRDKPANVAVAIEMSLELGIPIMQGIQNIAVINGRPGIFGDLGLALVEASGLLTDKRESFEGEYPQDDFRAVCILQRRGRQAERTEFAIADAKRAKLWGKEGPWTTAPQRMLQMRARWFNLRNNFADVLKGVQAAEEIIDITPEPDRGATPEEPAKVGVLKEKLAAARGTPVAAKPASPARDATPPFALEADDPCPDAPAGVHLPECKNYVAPASGALADDMFPPE